MMASTAPCEHSQRPIAIRTPTTDFVCQNHLRTFEISLLSQLYPLADNIQELSNKLQHANIWKLSQNPLEILEQWKNECHNIINELYKRKVKEIQLYSQKFEKQILETIIKQQNRIDNIQQRISQLTNDGYVTKQQLSIVKQRIQEVEANINQLKKGHILIETKPFLADELISVSFQEYPLMTTNYQKEIRSSKNSLDLQLKDCRLCIDKRLRAENCYKVWKENADKIARAIHQKEQKEKKEKEQKQIQNNNERKFEAQRSFDRWLRDKQ